MSNPSNKDYIVEDVDALRLRLDVVEEHNRRLQESDLYHRNVIAKTFPLLFEIINGLLEFEGKPLPMDLKQKAQGVLPDNFKNSAAQQNQEKPNGYLH